METHYTTLHDYVTITWIEIIVHIILFPNSLHKMKEKLKKKYLPNFLQIVFSSCTNKTLANYFLPACLQKTIKINKN